MGRYPKYETLEARKEAQRIQKRDYMRRKRAQASSNDPRIEGNNLVRIIVK